MTLLIKNGTIITLGENNRVLYDHSVLCDGELIKAIAPSKTFDGSYDKIIDAEGKVVMPGFINVHMHFYSTMARGFGKVAPSKDFNEVLQNLWWKLDKKLTLEDSYYSALIPLIDAVRHGTTTFIDHHASPFAVRGSLGRIADAVREVGLRASLCYEVSDRDGQVIADDGLKENADFIAQCKKDGDNQINGLFGLHASFTIGDRTMEKAAALGKELGVGFHVHAAEAKSDQEHCKKQHKLRVIERFNKFGILGPKTITAHCVHVNEHEMELLAETDTVVAHNPQSNMNNAVGVADLISLKKHGVLVGLGTDAMTTNMLEELRVALWAQHLSQANPSVGFSEVVEALFVNNPRIATRIFGLGLGELREGGAADVVIMDYDPPTPLMSGNCLGHLVFGISQSVVDTTVVGGRVLMENRQFKLDIDEPRVNARARELAAELWKRL
ncbi:MAG: putative aminohydrolase SsnA [Verrucomicrobiota bacterium]|jgi:putative selenium metabolism protein SsnA